MRDLKRWVDDRKDVGNVTLVSYGLSKTANISLASFSFDPLNRIILNNCLFINNDNK